jgi:hypothetical protein
MNKNKMKGGATPESLIPANSQPIQVSKTSSVDISNPDTPATIQSTTQKDIAEKRAEPKPYLGKKPDFNIKTTTSKPTDVASPLYNQLFTPLDQNPNQTYSVMPNYYYPLNQAYHITMPGPSGDHTRVSRMFDDILPAKDNQMTMITIGERLALYRYLRSIIIKDYEGELIGTDNNQVNHHILAYIRFLSVNSHGYSEISDNPYKTLPYRMILYNSCYPMSIVNNQAIAAKNASSINVRIYALNIAENIAYNLRDQVYREYPVWRELCFYEYMRENIIKRKKCPNFVLMYSYFMTQNNSINFHKMKYKELSQTDRLTRENLLFIETRKQKSLVNELVNNETLEPYLPSRFILKLPDEIKPELQVYSGTCLVIVTEGPTHNIYQWTSRIYNKRGAIREMTQHGFHYEKEWENITIQIMLAMACLQEHAIYIRDMTLKDHVYIKDLKIDGASAGYWKYRLNGVNYYVPNLGALVMIDSNFKQIEDTSVLPKTKRSYGMYFDAIYGVHTYNKDKLRKKICDNLKRMLNSNSFTNEHTKNYVNELPESIKSLWNRISSDPSDDISEIITKTMGKFLHNRIGTFLKRSEIEFIREIPSREFKRGDLVVYNKNGNKDYRWALFLSQENNQAKILCKSSPDDPTYNEDIVPYGNLNEYSSVEIIEQNVNNPRDLKISEENLLETYDIGND